MIIYVDIDETICINSENLPLNEKRDYTKCIPIIENINKINHLYDEGHYIVYWTARGSRSKINWYEFTYQQLVFWGVKFHELKCDKPYYDLFIEDRSKRIEEL